MTSTTKTSARVPSQRDDTLNAMHSYLKLVIVERARLGIAPDVLLENLLDKRVQHMRSNSLLAIRNRRLLLEEASAKLLVEQGEHSPELQEFRSVTLLTMLNILEMLVKDLTELGVAPGAHVDWVIEQLRLTRHEDIQPTRRKASLR